MAARERKRSGPSRDGGPLAAPSARAPQSSLEPAGRRLEPGAAALGWLETAPAELGRLEPGTRGREPDPSRRTSLVPSVWFFAVDDHDAGSRRAPAPRASRRRLLLATALLLGALVAGAVARGILLRALLPVALVVGAVVAMTPRRRSPPVAGAGRAIELSEDGVYFHAPGLATAAGAAPVLLASTRAPFGLTLVTTRRRDRVVVALSSSLGAYYLGATFGAGDRERHTALLARASIVSTDEPALGAVGPDGEPIELAPGDFRTLVDSLGAIDASCAQRFILSDARGAPVTLDGPDLRVQQHRFDLTAPLEWRAIVFQEGLGQAVAIYQGTWVRQGPSELVLISLLPSIAPLGPMTDADRTGSPELDGAIARDLRLLQATPEVAPPCAQRVAIDRVFMLPLRAALDRAPAAAARARGAA